jgi:hypothetical protein
VIDFKTISDIINVNINVNVNVNGKGKRGCNTKLSAKEGADDRTIHTVLF